MKTSYSKHDISKQPLTKNMDEGADIHFMTIPRVGKKDWDPHMTMTSPIEWETSPLVKEIVISNSPLCLAGNKLDHQDVIENNDTSPLPPCDSAETSSVIVAMKEKESERPHSGSVKEPRADSRANPNSDDFSGGRAHSESISKSRSGSSRRSRSETLAKHNRTKSITKNNNGGLNDTDRMNDASSTKPFIVVNVPQNAFMDSQNHNTILSVADDTATVVSDAVKCRYCLTNDTGSNDEALISPCQCCGTSKFVHKSCLEKWLTLRNVDACEVCKTLYRTKWVHRRLCSLKFPSMKKHDVFLLILTISFYVTLIFQFLGAVYVSMMASALPQMVTIVTLIGLSLGLFWFLTGSIALTIVLYTSDYWRAWRKSNKKKVLILKSASNSNGKAIDPMAFPEDLSMAVAV